MKRPVTTPQIVAAYRAGHSLDAIAERFGVSASTARYRLLCAHEPTRRPGRPRKKVA